MANLTCSPDPLLYEMPTPEYRCYALRDCRFRSETA